MRSCSTRERIELCAREVTRGQGKLWVNIRDANRADSIAIDQKRLDAFVRFLARLPPDLRPFGLMFEDGVGETFHWEMADFVSRLRRNMDGNGWSEGHLLIHVHKAFGLGDAVVLDALTAGCTGIWGAVCEEGAGVGHVSSLSVLTNLARLGNEHVTDMFDFPALREAAITVTQRCTMQDPHPKQELYGSRALDVVFSPDGMTPLPLFNLNELFKTQVATRVTTFTTPAMFRDRLTEVFGDLKWDMETATKMRFRLFRELNIGYKFDYMRFKNISLVHIPEL